jgi:predicted transcriptional regulator of viral defense system
MMALAFDQAGYFTAAQALEIGYTYQAQKYHADHGNWIRVDRGLFRLPEWPSRPEDAYVRWVLWSRGRGVISHETALVIHDLSDVNPEAIHLTVDPSFTAHDDAVVLHSAALPNADIEHHGAWSVTTPERTLLDVAGSELSQEHVDRAVADALARGLVTRRRLLRRSDAAADRAALRLERATAAATAGSA